MLVDAPATRWAACSAAAFSSVAQAREAAAEARQHVYLDLAGSTAAVLFVDPMQDDLRFTDLEGWSAKYDEVARACGLAPPDGYEHYADSLPVTPVAERRREADIAQLAQVQAERRRGIMRWENTPPPRPGAIVMPDPRVAIVAFMTRAQADVVVRKVGHLLMYQSVPARGKGKAALLLHHLPTPVTVDELAGRLWFALRAIEDVAGHGAVDSVRWPSG